MVKTAKKQIALSSGGNGGVINIIDASSTWCRLHAFLILCYCWKKLMQLKMIVTCEEMTASSLFIFLLNEIKGQCFRETDTFG